MKRIFFSSMALILFVNAGFSQVRLGVTVGGNASNFTESGVIAPSDRSYKLGFQAGIVSDIGVTSHLSVIPELLFSQRGSAYVSRFADTKSTVTTTLNYVQMPVNLALKLPMGGRTKLMIFAGGYAAYGLSGQMNFEAKMNGQTTTDKEDLVFGSKENEVNPLDYGVNVGLGAQFWKSFVKLQYNLGLNSLYNGTAVALHNTNIALSLGCFF